MKIGPGRLHCVVASSQARAIGRAIEEALLAHVRPEDVRPLQDSVFLVYADASSAEIRDWCKTALEQGESVFVVEFEKWSGYGPAPDRRWLLSRGH